MQGFFSDTSRCQARRRPRMNRRRVWLSNTKQQASGSSTPCSSTRSRPSRTQRSAGCSAKCATHTACGNRDESEQGEACK